MSLPPERISVKRRRDEAPIETFYLEQSTRAKRQFTAQSYQLLKRPIVPVSQQPPPVDRAVTAPAGPQSKHDQNGIPTIRSTAPGDEINDFTKFIRQQAQPASKEGAEEALLSTDSERPQATSPPKPSRRLDLPKDIRRFHLTRDLSSSHNASRPSGIRKKSSRSSSLRPPLPTFVERQVYDGLYAKPPVDKMVMEGSKTSVDSPSDTIDAQSKESVSIPTFVKPKTPPTKSGTSLQDPSRTWNRESDQLADELAALAMEMDPDAQPDSPVREAPSSSVAGPDIQPARPNPIEEEYIYETYIRISEENHSSNTMDPNVSVSNVGVLVIDEEDEDLWEGYMQSDDESDWDDEDSNAEDNPANDYPDEELSSDDEFSRNPYRYHQGDLGYDDDDSDHPTYN
ncbi:uncharacterized protein HMPREF1541_00759 [Cyphellophora europaea CBS 101466]|uniref:Transcription factor Iwr1 domain-containing protein n=1 Tax=Cyphellophora europaea (strain CBS 101466) TaxID=1220924 RepID=W2SF92_CYPE1|nr:uncharacterized protein HMPREF1541_00759 [Cyphellophora europaea CBS 101466]ETN46574.1 hypothetical protein HMPREF1541_00759 [Cyphellophora europaea CBS 101466]